jgi:hypothetical protein
MPRPTDPPAVCVTSLFRPPYGLAFTIQDLLRIRHWCEKRGLQMDVALDQSLEDVEFEELLVISPQNREKRSFTMWRTLSSTYVQTPTGAPRAFPGVIEALESLRAARPRRNALLRFFRLAH